MRYLILFFLISITPFLTRPTARGQTVSSTGIRRSIHIDETTQIIDKSIGQRISYKTYRELMDKDRYGYYLSPVIDKYGQPSAYTLRPTTAEERETNSIRDIDTTLRPKVGEQMPEFVMKGINGTDYQSTALTGRVVVLSFWVSLNKPFWGPGQAKGFADILQPYQLKDGLISLGIVQESKEAIAKFMDTETLPFIPIPNSYGFNKKFQVTTSPTFIVINRSGNVAAFVEGQNYDQLRKVLQGVQN